MEVNNEPTLTFIDLQSWVTDATIEPSRNDRAGDLLNRVLEYMADCPVSFAHDLLGAYLAASEDVDLDNTIMTNALAYTTAKDAQQSADEEHRRRVMELTDEWRDNGGPFGAKV